MKEATGELNMTVVTLIAVAALGAVFYFAVWPLVQTMLMNNTCKTYGVGYHAVRNNGVVASSGSADVYEWACCPSGTETVDTKNCIMIPKNNTNQTPAATGDQG